MIKYAADVNEEIFHIFGYAKGEGEENTTPFMDYEGKAHPENVAKTNYYKELNKRAWEKRMKVKHGELPEEKIQCDDSINEAFSLINHWDVIRTASVVDHLNYEGV